MKKCDVFMRVNKAKEVYQNRSKWKSVFLSTLPGNRRKFMYYHHYH